MLITPDDFIPVPCNYYAWYRIIPPYEVEPDKDAGYYIRLVIDRNESETHLTFGPMDADDVDTLCPLLRNVHLHVHEQTRNPYESLIAHARTISQGGEEDDEEEGKER